MGATHPSRVTPLLPESYAALTPEEVAEQIKNLGEAYDDYAEKVVKDGLDGVCEVVGDRLLQMPHVPQQHRPALVRRRD